jgi:peptidoglycan hydrolase CwlO-like protein
MDKIMAMCWVDRECEVVPYDPGEFAKAQDRIQALKEKVDHNQRVLEELEAKVAELGLTEDRYSIRTLRGERLKAQEMMDFLRMQTDQRLRPKWDAVLEVGGTREMYEKLPEVVAANQKLQAEIEPLEQKIKVLDEQIAALDAIVSKFRR